MARIFGSLCTADNECCKTLVIQSIQQTKPAAVKNQCILDWWIRTNWYANVFFNIQNFLQNWKFRSNGFFFENEMKSIANSFAIKSLICHFFSPKMDSFKFGKHLREWIKKDTISIPTVDRNIILFLYYSDTKGLQWACIWIYCRRNIKTVTVCPTCYIWSLSEMLTICSPNMIFDRKEN